MNSSVAVSLTISIQCYHILYYNSIFSFVTWPVIPVCIIMFINKFVEYNLLFSIDGISLGNLIIRVRGGLAIHQSGLTNSYILRQ